MRRAVRLLASVLMVSGTIGLWWLAPSGASAQTAGGVTVVTSQQTSYGTALFTADGKALYLLSYDTVGTRTSPAESSCTGKCAAAWPPLLAAGPMGVQAQGGVNAAGLGTIPRPEGTFQVTYFGHPLYMFINDKTAGQATGENVAAFNGIWNLVNLMGQPAPGTATVILQSSAQGQVLAAPTAFSTVRSLYELTTDPSNMSTCFGGCAQFWWPLLTSGRPNAGAGVNPGGLGTISRPDGSLQVTYDGVPLYFFAFDLAAGAKSGLTNGEDNVDQFANGMWYLVGPNGAAVPSAASVGTISTPMGTVLSFGKNPLYAFSRDAAGGACSGLCARTWTPLITTGAPQATASSGVNQSDLGAVQRADGTAQVTYKGRPLYQFALDFQGTSGQGLGVFGGTFNLVQAGGGLTSGPPSSRAVIAVPQLSTSGPGVSASFLVAFTSKAPGTAMVLFGSGPGCSGLVEAATQDAGAGTTSHSVLVSGNELSGSVGDNGIQPGATYSFEVVTSSSAGNETGNNKGNCYTVTIPAS